MKKHSRPGESRIQRHNKPKDTFNVRVVRLWPDPKKPTRNYKRTGT